MDPVIAGTRAELAEVRAKMDGTVAVVMTMGALHAGHEALIDAARARADHVIVTIFVNPLQFGPNEDFDRYPRTFDDDVARCAEHGVEVIFAPSRDEMYPGGQPQVRLDPGPRGEILEGASRPGFFHGVLTVVAKLLHLTRPDYAFFGEKDYQQLALVRQMVADLDIPTEIVGVPIYREADGLALSSRNRYLSESGRSGALALYRALAAGVAAAERGHDAAAVRSAAGQAFTGTRDRDTAERVELDYPATAERVELDYPATTERAELDYLVLTAPDLGPVPASGPARLLVAAWVGRDLDHDRPGTRLIDNTAIHLGTAASPPAAPQR